MPSTQPKKTRVAVGFAAILWALGAGSISAQQPPEEGPFDRLISQLQESRVERALNRGSASSPGKPGVPTKGPSEGTVVSPGKGPALPGGGGPGPIPKGRGVGTPVTGKPESGTEALGIEIRVRDGEPQVTAVQAGSPGEAAGVKPRDRILIVAGKQGRGLTAEQVAALLRGAGGPEVKVAVARGEEVLLLRIAQGAGAIPRVAEAQPMMPGGETLSLVGFDAREWKLTPSGRGQVAREDDDLVVKVPENAAGGAEGWSRLPVRGDFTLDFGHFLGEWEPQAGDTLAVEFRFAPAPGGEAPLVIRRRIDAAGKDTLEIVTAGQTRVVNVSTSQLTLQLRRKGTRLLLSRFDLDSGDQVPVASFTPGLADTVFIGLAAQKTGAARLSLNLYLSNGEPIELK